MAIYLNILSKFDKKGFAKAESGMAKFGKNVGKIAAVATAAIGAIAVKGVQSFADFDAKMQQSVAIMGNVSDAMRNDMANAAREVAKTTTFSADQAAESFFFLASAGLDAEQSLKALPKVASFAQAGMFDMALATDLLTDAQSALGLSVDDTEQNMANMSRVSDVLVKANTLANASVEQFSSSLTNKAGAALKMVNKDVEEGVAVLAAFADQGVKGELAGNQLSIVMRDLSTKAIKNASEFKAFGLEVFDADGNMNNMADIIGDLETGLAGMSDETAKASLLQMGFSDRTLGSLMTLLGTSDAIREYEGELRKAGGTTEEVAGKQLETISGQFALMKSALEDVGLEIGKILIPILLTLMTALQPAIDRLLPIFAQIFEDLTPILEQLAFVFVDLVEALLPFLPIIGDIAGIVLDLISQLLPPFVDLIDALLPIFETLIPLVGDFLSDVMSLFAPLLTDIIEQLAPLIEQMMPIFAELFEALAPLVVDLIEAGMPLIEELLPLIGYILETVVIPMMQWLVETINNNVVPALGYLIGVFAVWAAETSETISSWRQRWYEFSTWLIGSLNTMLSGLEDWTNGWVENINKALAASNEFLGTDFDMVGKVTFGEIEMPEPPGINLSKFRDVDTTGVRDVLDRYSMGALDSGGGGNRETGGGQSIFSPGVLQETVAKMALRDKFGIDMFPGANASVSAFAKGGIVTGPVLGMIGEAGPEAIIPLNKARGLGGTYNITVNAGMGSDGQRIGEQIVKEIRRYERLSGPVFARA